jgi:flagellar L-ring protein precursor FlgH
MRVVPILIAAAALLLAAPSALAQAQARLKQNTAKNEVDGKPDDNASLRTFSRFIIEAPKPKAVAVHDIVTIIISESSKQTSAQKLDTKTDTSLNGSLNKFPSLGKLVGGELAPGGSSPVTAVDVAGGNKYKADATYQRDDAFSDKISAEVVDVKPNGTIVIEARRTVTKDKEVQKMVLSGKCRREDITTANSVLSTQLADLTITVCNDGELRRASQPGWITRAMRTIFDF